MLMHQRIIRQTLLVLYFLLSYDGVQGKIELSKLEELELEEQLKLLNKPPVKTIKSKSGDIYNCVDFYKQPAFDHPLLKNHNFHPEIDNKSESKGRYSSGAYKLAIARILENSNNKFAGAGMATSIWNPHVEGRQHSAYRLKIQNGSDIIQVGWRVDPTLYRDNKTRLFVHFQAGNIHCFNILCPGFVQVNHETPVDMIFDKISHRGDRGSWEYTVYIDRDLVNGNWWLLVDESYDQVGFWPQKIFTNLAYFANNIEWGGVAYSPPGVPKPPMGSSFFPIGNSDYDAYCRRLTVLNDKGATIDVDTITTYVRRS